jgi:hypothetical protein
MKDAPYAVSFSYTRYSNDGRCYGCWKELPTDHARFAFIHTTNYRNSRSVSCSRACDTCADMDEAVAIAKDEGLRFTAVGVNCGPGVNFEGDPEDFEILIGGQRCMCGNVTLIDVMRVKGYAGSRYSYGKFCLACAKDLRMLAKAEAETKFIRKALAELRKEIKHLNQNSLMETA